MRSRIRPPTKLPAPPVGSIQRDAAYTYATATALLGLDYSTLRRAVRREGLRYAVVGNQRKLFLGRWLLEWIERREVERDVT